MSCGMFASIDRSAGFPARGSILVTLSPRPAPVNHASGVVAMAALIVRAEEIGAEDVPRIVPHRVDVIGVVLRIVELDEHARPVDTVVVRAARIDRSRPREVKALDAGLPDPPEVLLGHLGGSGRPA